MISADELSEREKHIFDEEFHNFIKSNYPEKTHEIMRDSRDSIIYAITRTKNIHKSYFEGIFPNAANFGWSFPSPLFFFLDKDTWLNQYKKGSWTTWIDKDLYSSNATFLLLGFYVNSEPSTCKISSIYVESDGKTYPQIWIKNSISESRIYLLPIPILSESVLKIKTLSESDCVCELTPLGIYFGSKLYEACYRQPQIKQ